MLEGSNEAIDFGVLICKTENSFMINGSDGAPLPTKTEVEVTFHCMMRSNGAKLVVFTKAGAYIGDVEFEGTNPLAYPVLAAVMQQFVQSTQSAVQTAPASVLAGLDRATKR